VPYSYNILSQKISIFFLQNSSIKLPAKDSALSPQQYLHLSSPALQGNELGSATEACSA
jgi:hypothetical protein